MSNNTEVELSEYNPDWIELFEVEKELLQSLIGKYIDGAIEHVGSTSITGMVAKPIIDIMIGVDSLARSKAAIHILSENGYCYYPYKSDVMHWFCKPSPEIRTHHLHLIPFESPLWQERVAFRDHLQSHPNIAEEYAELKRMLSVKYNQDRELYTQAKWPFVKATLASIGINK